MGGRGSGGGGGGMLRTGHRIRSVRAGVASGGAVQEPFSHSTTNTTANTSTRRPTNKKSNASNNTLSLCSSSTAASSSSSPFSSFNFSLSATSTALTPHYSCSSPLCGGDEFEWECVADDGIEDERSYWFCDDFVFGTVPSTDEVQNAVSALQRVLSPTPFWVNDRYPYRSGKDLVDQVASQAGSTRGASSVGSELDWIEPPVHLTNLELLQNHGCDTVYDAFHLLQTEPSVQRMVISLSSDKAVWNAVLNNEVVRELRKLFNEADNSSPRSPNNAADGSDAARGIVSWILDNAKEKIMEIVEKITKVVNELFKLRDSEKTTVGKDPFEGTLRTSFLLSVVVLLIVVVTRAHNS